MKTRFYMFAIGAACFLIGLAINRPVLTMLGLSLQILSILIYWMEIALRKITPANQGQSLLEMKPFYDTQRRLELLSIKTPDDSPSKSLVKDALFAGKAIVDQAEELATAKKKLGALLFEQSEFRVKHLKLVERNAPTEEIQHIEEQIAAYGAVKESSVELDKRIGELSREFETLVTQLSNGSAVEANQSINLEDRELIGELKALASTAEEVKNWISSTSELNYERNQTSS